MNEDQFVKIANHLQDQLDSLDKIRIVFGQNVDFREYKAVYDTLIALRQAQALETIAERLSRIGSIILDK